MAAQDNGTGAVSSTGLGIGEAHTHTRPTAVLAHVNARPASSIALATLLHTAPTDAIEGEPAPVDAAFVAALDNTRPPDRPLASVLRVHALLARPAGC